jgi:hypothetical protein
MIFEKDDTKHRRVLSISRPHGGFRRINKKIDVQLKRRGEARAEIAFSFRPAMHSFRPPPAEKILTDEWLCLQCRCYSDAHKALMH